jgi:2-phosphosulfolactate phosphatase
VRTRIVGIDGCSGITGAAVVIDVIRAYTVAAWALAGGARRIVVAPDVDEAIRLRDALGAIAVNDGAPDGIFDLVNSPEALAAADVAGRDVVLRTQAGTVGAFAARHADLLLCTGLVTATATARELRSAGVEEVTLVATGGDDDVACAEYIAARLDADGATVDAAPFVERAGRSDVAEALRGYVRAGNPAVGRRDVDLCLEVDRFDFALRGCEQDGLLVLVRSDQPSAPAGR